MTAKKIHTILLDEIKELHPVEGDTFAVDFANRLPSGVTLFSGAFVVEVDASGDLSPVALSITEVSISGSQVQATIAKGTATLGTIRYLRFGATKSDGKTIANVGRVKLTKYDGA